MERVIKFMVLLFLGMALHLPVYAQVHELSECIKTFPIGYEKLYYLTLSAVSEYNCAIDEIQTKGGYIIFKTENKQKFLASIVYVSASKSMLKITPCDGNYDFTQEILQKIFSYIEQYQTKNF